MRQMVQPAKGPEPSMEEILASIRRIIADDDGAKAQPADSVAPQPAPSPARPASPPRAMGPPPPIEPMTLPSAAPALAKEKTSNFPAPASFALESDTAAESPDILDSAEQMAVEARPVADVSSIDAELDLIFEETPPAPSAEPLRPVMAEAPAPVDPPVAEPPAWHAPARAEQSLMSAATSAAVDSAFNTLAQTVLVQNGRTLEDLVREMLRPMLKTWLDDNLPGMVERLVRAEIERVSRGRP
jgi:cell pole-organizing protein PopZ